MLDNLSTMLPLIQMLSGNNKDLNMSEMLSNLTGNSDTANAFKNADGNNDMLSALSSLMQGGGNFNDLLKNTGSNNMLSMLPLLQTMMGSKKPKQHKKAEPIIETVQSENRSYNLKPISKIANKDITYVLNQYFAE